MTFSPAIVVVTICCMNNVFPFKKHVLNTCDAIRLAKLGTCPHGAYCWAVQTDTQKAVLRVHVNRCLPKNYVSSGKGHLSLTSHSKVRLSQCYSNKLTYCETLNILKYDYQQQKFPKFFEAENSCVLWILYQILIMCPAMTREQIRATHPCRRLLNK